MPSPFNEDERLAIRRQLLQAGRNLFSTIGLKKTTLAELVRPAGIAKSSFYAFFDSKEALYLELLAEEAPEVERQVLPPLTADMPAREAIEQFLARLISEYETNPLMRRLLTHQEELMMVARRVPPELFSAKLKGVAQPVLTFVQRAQERGELVRGVPEVLAGVIQAVTLLVLHRETIGEQLYPNVVAAMIKAVAAGLTGVEQGGPS